MRGRMFLAGCALALSCAVGLRAADPVYSKLSEIAIGGAGAFD